MGILEPSQSNMPVYQYQKNNKCDAKKLRRFQKQKNILPKKKLALERRIFILW
jgi:hypothetical protein